MGLSPSSASAHPRLLFDAQRLQDLQSNRDSESRRDLTAALRTAMDLQHGKALKTSLDSDKRLVGNALGGYALAAAILDREADWTLARQSLINSVSWGDWGFGEGDDLNRAHLMIGAAIAYDLLYPQLNESQRQSVRNRLAAEADRFHRAVNSGIWWTQDFAQNHNWINFAALGLVGFVLDGEDARAESWVASAWANSQQLQVVYDAVSDGSWHEGVGYQQYGLSMAIPYWIASSRHGREVSDSAMVRNYGKYRLYTMLPQRPRNYLSIHGDWTGWAGEGSALLLRYVATLFRDPLAQEAARRWVGAGQRSRAAWDILSLGLEYVVLDPSVPNAKVGELPLHHYARDQQLAVLKSSWGDGALMVGLKNGVLGGRGNFDRLKAGQPPGSYLNVGHDHMDDLGLWIYGDGEWLLPEVVGYNIGRTSGPKAWMSEFHNTILFDGKGQLGDDRGNTHASSALPWFFERDATMPLRMASQNYAFVRGDGRRLYPASLGIERLNRTVVLSRDGHAVLHDEASLSSPRKMEQLFHFMDGASTSGAWLRGEAKNGRLLGIRVVAPAAFSSSIKNVTADKLNKHFEPDGAMSRATLRPMEAAKEHHFLELLWPARTSNWEQRPQVSALDLQHPERGFRFALSGGGEETWVFSGNQARSAGDIRFDAEIGALRRDGQGEFSRIVLLGQGTLADHNGERLLMQAPRPGLIEAERVGDALFLSGSDPSGARVFAPGVTRVFYGGSPVSKWHHDRDTVVLSAAPKPQPEPDPEPVDPGQPGEPGNPTEPGSPSNPGNPSDPGNPTEPGNPSEPVEPVDPSEPGGPADPADPSEPVDPVEPGEPGLPSEPTEPGKPSQPGDLDHPTEPSAPGWDDEGGGDAKPGDGVADNSPPSAPQLLQHEGGFLGFGCNSSSPSGMALLAAFALLLRRRKVLQPAVNAPLHLSLAPPRRTR